MRSSTVVFVGALLCACGPGSVDAGELFDDVEIVVDPGAWVPFAAAPTHLSATASIDDGQFTWTPAEGSAAESWRILGQRGDRILIIDELNGPAPVRTRGYDRVGVQALSGDFATAVVWAQTDGSETNTLSSPPDRRSWSLPRLLSVATGSTLIRADVSVVLFGAAPPDLSGNAALVLRMEADSAEIQLRSEGVVDEVRDGGGQPLTVTTVGNDLVVDLGAAHSAGDLVALDVDWHIDDLTHEVGSRPVADAEPTLAYVGDLRAWFPRPDEDPAPEVRVTLQFDVPAGYEVFSAGLGPTRAASGAGRETVTFLPGAPLGTWPIFVAGDYVVDATNPAVVVAPRAPFAGTPTEFTAFAGASVTEYTRVFGAMPVERTSLVQVPVAFSIGFAGPQVALIPVSDWSVEPSKFGRFLLAHELSHTWWAHGSFLGDLLDLWLVEGMADYSAARALRAIDGPDAEREQVAADLALLTDLMKNGFGGSPGRDVPVRPDRRADLQDYIFYLKGAWVLRHLESVVGTAVMDQTLERYHGATLFQRAGTPEFTDAAEQSLGAPLDWYWDQWLSGTGLPEITVEPFYRRASDGSVEMHLSVVQLTRVGGQSPWRLPFRVELRDADVVQGDPTFCSTLPAEILTSPSDCQP